MQLHWRGMDWSLCHTRSRFGIGVPRLLAAVVTVAVRRLRHNDEQVEITGGLSPVEPTAAGLLRDHWRQHLGRVNA